MKGCWWAIWGEAVTSWGACSGNWGRWAGEGQALDEPGVLGGWRGKQVGHQFPGRSWEGTPSSLLLGRIGLWELSLKPQERVGRDQEAQRLSS